MGLPRASHRNQSRQRTGRQEAPDASHRRPRRVPQVRAEISRSAAHPVQTHRCVRLGPSRAEVAKRRSLRAKSRTLRYLAVSVSRLRPVEFSRRLPGIRLRNISRVVRGSFPSRQVLPDQRQDGADGAVRHRRVPAVAFPESGNGDLSAVPRYEMPCVCRHRAGRDHGHS